MSGKSITDFVELSETGLSFSLFLLECDKFVLKLNLLFLMSTYTVDWIRSGPMTNTTALHPFNQLPSRSQLYFAPLFSESFQVAECHADDYN